MEKKSGKANRPSTIHQLPVKIPASGKDADPREWNEWWEKTRLVLQRSADEVVDLSTKPSQST